MSFNKLFGSMVILLIILVFPVLTGDIGSPDMSGNKSASNEVNEKGTDSNIRIGTSNRASYTNYESNEYIEKHYTWNYGLGEWNWKIRINNGHYDYFKNLKRPATEDYSTYITNPLNKTYISNLVKEFQEGARENGYSERDTVNYVVAFVQSLEYVPDDISTGYDEYPKYPLETLVDGGGDCEDTSILLASLLHEMGYGVILLSLSNHMAIGVKGEKDLPGYYFNYEGERYYFLETTASNWKVGDVPDMYRNQKAKIYPVVPHPVITHKWKAETQNYKTAINIEVTNEGTATAYGTKVYAVYAAEDNLVYDQAISDSFTLKPQETADVTLHLRYIPNVRGRIEVKIVSEGILLDESHSEWKQT